MLSSRCTRSFLLRPSSSSSSSPSTSTPSLLLLSRPRYRPFSSTSPHLLHSTSSTLSDAPPLSPLQRKIVKAIRNGVDPDDRSSQGPTPTRPPRKTTLDPERMSVWPPPASYKKKGVHGIPGKRAQASFSPPTRPAGSGGPTTGRSDKDGWKAAHAPGAEPWDPRQDGFKKLKFYKGGVSGGVPKWIQRKKDALDEERYDTSTPNPRHGGAGAGASSSSFESSRSRAGGDGKEYKKPRSLGGRHDRRSRTATTSEHYESPRTLSMHLLAATKEGHMMLEDAYERVLAAPGDVGNVAGVWNTLMTIALKTRNWNKAVGYYNEVSLGKD